MAKKPNRNDKSRQIEFLPRKKLFPGTVESSLRKIGFHYMLGVDEAGRGPLAGHVVAAACMLPEKISIKGINDSKRLSPAQRESLFSMITGEALCFGIAMAEPWEIDRINILQATFGAMKQAIGQAISFSSRYPEIVLIDGNLPVPDFFDLPQKPVVKGDQLSINIAAASILAKVTRDRMMIEYDRQYPEYGFAVHKGYGTRQHIEAIRKYGLSPIHRKSFKLNLL
jgi:ribonuclease HII